ncbi:hypothetical protein JX266_008772 [Neoarthrinium moseri]|nr:hypothetical protein JX266_008772 [Neoarthrinium moseri]
MRTRASARLAAEDAAADGISPITPATPPGHEPQNSPGESTCDRSPGMDESATTRQLKQSLTTPPTDTQLNHLVAPASTKSATTMVSKKRTGRKGTKEPVRGGWDNLPHNLGRRWEPSAPSSGIQPVPAIDASTTSYGELDAETGLAKAVAATGYHLRPRKTVATTDNDTSPASNDRTDAPVLDPDTGENTTGGPPKKRPRQSRKAKAIEDGDVVPGIETEKPRKKARKTKDNPYGLTPGETPYPDWQSPSAQQCQEVYDILVGMHDDVKPLPPQKIPAPSLEVAGCGEVPSILDGLIRTVLSGSTTFDMADKMLQALVKKFGVLEEGVGKGSVNWNNVRLAEYDEVYQQLKPGGLGANKAKNIQTILQMVYDENMERRAAYLREKETGIAADVTGASDKTVGQKDLEILRANQEMLSLDHMHSMETHEAMLHFVRYPGVGVKTAACVTLFSLQRPCFAVDTHVFRMSRWLGWVPPKTNEDNTFSHLEVRCPNQLKYGLHQLFIRHGKTCHRCNDKSFMGTDAWDEAVCPMEHLLDRFTKRTVKLKDIKPKEEVKPAKGKKKAVAEDDQGRHGDDESDDKGAKDMDQAEPELGDGVQGSHKDDDDQESELSELSDLDEGGLDIESFEG